VSRRRCVLDPPPPAICLPAVSGHLTGRTVRGPAPQPGRGRADAGQGGRGDVGRRRTGGGPRTVDRAARHSAGVRYAAPRGARTHRRRGTDSPPLAGGTGVTIVRVRFLLAHESTGPYRGRRRAGGHNRETRA